MNALNVDTAGIGGKYTLIRGDLAPVAWEVSQSHSNPALLDEGLNVYLPEIELGVVVLLRIVFQQASGMGKSQPLKRAVEVMVGESSRFLVMVYEVHCELSAHGRLLD